jgi:hypothetical protein
MKTSGNFKTEERRNECWDKLCENNVVDIKSYRKYLLKNHPDRNSNLTEEERVNVPIITACWGDWSDKSSTAKVDCPRPPGAQFMQQKESEFDEPDDRNFYSKQQDDRNFYSEQQDSYDSDDERRQEEEDDWDRRWQARFHGDPEEKLDSDAMRAAENFGDRKLEFYHFLRTLLMGSWFSKEEEVPGTTPQDLYNMYANWICKIANITREQLNPVLFAALKNKEDWAFRIVTFKNDPSQVQWFESVLLPKIMTNSAESLTDSYVLPVMAQTFYYLGIKLGINFDPISFIQTATNLGLAYQKEHPESSNIERWRKMVFDLFDNLIYKTSNEQMENLVIWALQKRFPWAVKMIATLGLKVPAQKSEAIVVSDNDEEEEEGEEVPAAAVKKAIVVSDDEEEKPSYDAKSMAKRRLIRKSKLKAITSDSDSDEEEEEEEEDEGEENENKVSKNKCKAFQESRWTINPMTGREIDPRGATAKKVAKECGMLDLLNKWKKDHKRNSKKKRKD